MLWTPLKGKGKRGNGGLYRGKKRNQLTTGFLGPSSEKGERHKPRQSCPLEGKKLFKKRGEKLLAHKKLWVMKDGRRQSETERAGWLVEK